MFPSSAEQESSQSPMPLIGLKLAPPSSESQESAIQYSRSPPSASSTPAPTKRRRSVSPSCSSLWSASSAKEAMDRVDECFPEVLAQDLELSADVFAAKKMTAGTPLSSLSFEDMGKPRTCRMVPSSPYLAASARVQTLGAIEERRSMVSFLDQEEPRVDDATSDVDSRSSTNTSEDMAPPSFRHRESVMTVATSLASTNWKPSLQRSSPPPEGPCQSSWIDGDSDGEEQDDVKECNTGSLSPRPPTPPESELDSGGVTGLKKIDLRGHWSYNETTLHRKSHSVSGASPISCPRTKVSRTSFDMPTRPFCTAGIRRQEGRESAKHSQVPAPFTAPRAISPRPEQTRPQRAHKTTDTADKPPAKPLTLDVVAEPSSVSEDFADSEVETMLPTGMLIYPQPPPPQPALRSVQSWLNSSLQPYPRSLQNEDLTRVVPLPPDAMETLRVSIACFPETMLLSSSLTIETIRTYSKKVRQPSLEFVRSPSPESPRASRRSLWRRVVPYKRASLGSERMHNHSSGESSVDSSNSGSVDAPKLWEPLKNVLGSCSDYVCDALYAHIVAYNYMSALVARNPPPPAKAGRTHGHRASDSRQDDIPKKAASLLGLISTGDVATAGFDRRSRRLTAPLGAWAREEMVNGQATPSANHENMQSDLLRCISRLVATAKLMAEGGEEQMLDMDVEDSDKLFVRSLCEIVKMVEEAS
ncbi:Uncharacterized protein TPAR_07660 [Tolypocladium paradoxum]|uniref:Uncharacterized protein n=1 Tax=Tolypocladium paradoxum TaxID=94208 RepID=A0A2S4KPK7_9HYPO|nr:Uncharacterized protein TPAR_07660 [Tolypocladium paradoxum]